MQRNIYNVQILMTSQNSCDRMKQICEDYGLNYYWNDDESFLYKDGQYDIFSSDDNDCFLIMESNNKEPITIEQFLELLNEK